MAILTVQITQDNKDGNSTLCPIHSPLVFIADVTYNGAPPDELNVVITDAVETLGEYRAIYLEDTQLTRRFAFIANDAIKSIMSDFEETYQLNETAVNIPNITKEANLRFESPDDPGIFDTVGIVFIHGAAQFGQNPNFVEIFTKNDYEIFAVKDKPAYAYFFFDDTEETSIVDFYEDGVFKIQANLTENRFLRYKTNATGVKVIEALINGISYFCTINPIDLCSDLFLKYLDSKGKYQFFPMNQMYEKKESVSAKGQVLPFITSILSDQTNRKNIGYDAKKQLLVSSDLTQEHLDFYADLWVSPRVYFYIGSGTDLVQDWLEVTIKGDGILKTRKGKFIEINMTIEFPETFTVKMI